VSEQNELEIVIFPHPFLRHQAIPFTPDQIKTTLVRETAAAMIRCMYQYHGVGLASEQVGCPQAVIVIDTGYAYSGKKAPRIMFNPKILEADPETIALGSPGEGCLSLPYGYHQPVKRYENVRVQWLDSRCREKERWFTGFEAIVVQHEIDHLDGRLFIDHLSKLKQSMFLAKVRKQHRLYWKGVKSAQSAIRNAERTPAFNMKRTQEYEKHLRSMKNNA